MAKTVRLKLQTVLILDADLSRREQLMQSLIGEGFMMRAVGTPKEALLAMRRTDFDLVLIEDDRPRDVLNALRPQAPSARFAVLHGVDDLDVFLELQSLGAQDVINDRVAPEELARRMRKLMPRAA